MHIDSNPSSFRARVVRLSRLQQFFISFSVIAILVTILFTIETKGISSRPDADLFNNVQMITLPSA